MIAAQAEAPESELLALTATPPAPLARGAFHGPVGRVVSKLAPETEADPAALLLNLLAAIGNIVGRTAYTMAGSDMHYPSLYTVLVGDTSDGRKGTSWSTVRPIVNDLDPQWSKKCQCAGVSTGEGLISTIQDATEELQQVRDREGVKGYRTVTRPGTDDKRVMICDGEFAQTIRVMQRDGNTLSAVFRNAWDCPGVLELKTKGVTSRATKPHVGFMGMITGDELARTLNKGDIHNGVANRVLWLYTRRSQFLPRGGKLDQIDISTEMSELRQAIELAREGGVRDFDESAYSLWDSEYIRLTSGRRGAFGAATGRAAPYVKRLALLFSLLDGAREIGEQHLRAALALWRYCEDSARFLFGDGGVRADAKKILIALRALDGREMSRSEITAQVFKGRITAAELDGALAALKGAGLAEGRTEKTAGRSSEIWFAVTREAAHET